MVIAAGATEDVPLRVAAYSPGTFVLGEYRVSWEPAAVGEGHGQRQVVGGQAVGRSVGHPSQACNAPFIVSVAKP